MTEGSSSISLPKEDTTKRKSTVDQSSTPLEMFFIVTTLSVRGNNNTGELRSKRRFELFHPKRRKLRAVLVT